MTARRFRPGVLLAAAGLAACAASPSASPATAADGAAQIEMETRSWGRLASRWSIAADGSIRLTRPEPGIFDARETVTRRFEAGPRAYSEIRALLGEAERHAGRALPCERRITDMRYGEARWMRAAGAPATLAFDAGCMDAPARPILRALEAADRRVAEWAGQAMVVERQPVSPGE